MPITPTGSPIWDKANPATIEQYGGDLSKRNYLDRKGIDALTDVSASQFTRATADLVSMAHTAPFAIVTIILTPDTAPIVEFVHMATAVRLTTYHGDDAPTGFPSAVRNGTSDITLTFADTYSDAYGVADPFAIAHVVPSVIYKSVARAVVEKLSDTSIRVRVFDAIDAPITEGALSGPSADILRVSLMVG